MKWYGLKSSATGTKKNINYRKNFKTKIIGLTFSNKRFLNFSFIQIYIPSNWNVIFYNLNNKKNMFFFSDFYFFFLPFNENARFSQITNSVELKLQHNHNFNKIYFYLFKNLFFCFTKFFFRKIKFKGKGYYLFKNLRNTIAMRFGYSHRVKIFSYIINVKFLSKTSVFMFGLNKKDIFERGDFLCSKKPQNIFTGRGLRFSKQITYKKIGKVSSYR